MNIFKVSLLPLVALLLLSMFKAQAQDSYTITVESIADRKVKVEAMLFPKGDTLLMSPYGAAHLKNGWATFVENLTASTSTGDKITVNKVENGVFVLSQNSKNQPVHLNYSVNIHHDKGSNYDLIYSGGLLFADKLNAEIKKASNNRKDIGDFLKNMNAAYSTAEKPVQTEDIKRVAEQTCSCSLNNLFQEVND